jgi:AraC-like DNA-binding protein
MMSIENLRQSLAGGFDRWAPNEGATSSGVPGLTFYRHISPTAPHVGIVDASLSLVVAGRKKVVLGSHTFDYGSSHFLLTSINLPLTAWVTQASPSDPYLGILLRIELAAVRALLLVADHDEIGVAPPLGIARANVTSDLLEAMFRLCRLNERPSEIDLFAEPMQREVIYRLLTSPIGPHLRALASTDGTSGGVMRALDWLKQNFRERQSPGMLAEIAGVGVSTLYRNFKVVTAMSPVQYRKHLQLNEARRLMIVSGLDAASAAYDVGYESPSQFSREYRRAFGQPPTASVASLRRSVQANAPVTQP